MNIRSVIKVLLVLVENIFFSIFPNSRPIIEKYIFNPYQFNEKHLEYSKKQFDNFLKKVGGTDTIRGKKLLELGPGGSLGFGILALKNGASKYYAIDENSHSFFNKPEFDIYMQLIENEEIGKQIFIERADKKFSYNKNRIDFLEIGQTSLLPLPDDSIDVIYSCAVLEHVHDLDSLFSEMHRVLRKGGIMNHEIDLRDHIFSQKKLFFLLIPEKIFRFLFGKTGAYVNRKRASYYEKLVKKLNLEVLNITDTVLKNEKELKKYLKEFSLEDLKTQTINLTLKKDEIRDIRFYKTK
jgi:ubiquinone/menaquinone biosynthesis C-methylase UbiE